MGVFFSWLIDRLFGLLFVCLFVLEDGLVWVRFLFWFNLFGVCFFKVGTGISLQMECLCFLTCICKSSITRAKKFIYI